MGKEEGRDVRQRNLGGENLLNATQKGFQNGSKDRKIPSRYISERIFVYILLYMGVLLLIAMWSYHRLPLPKTVAEHGGSGEFLEERARAHVAAITSLGPRPSGSRANEVHCVEYLLKSLEKIKKMAVPGVHEIEVDISYPEGSFTMDIWGGFTPYYKKITNIVARLSPGKDVVRQGENAHEHSLLVNGHFDTVEGSPGASDDATSCGIMLEILQNLATSSDPVRHDIIFLFNGAEENVLPASHAFITQHPWRKNIKVFINLEAAGAGGRELVFQTGPDHPWLLRAYAQHAKHPFATVIGQDVFQAELIPSDTDFRIFRDFGNIPGVDIAYVSNGYVYHTKYDSLDSIPPGCIQRAGDNIQALVLHLANSSTLHHGIEEDRHGSMVFFDIHGFYLVTYPARMGMIINMCVVGAVFLFIIFRRKPEYSSRLMYLSKLLRAVGVILASYLAVLATSAFIILLLTLTNREMSWYAHPPIIFGLYWAPSVYMMIRVHRSLGGKLHTVDTKANPWILESLFFDASMLIWSMMIALMTLKGIGSAYMLMISVLFAVLGRSVLWKRMTSFQEGTRMLPVFLAYVCFTIVPMGLWLYLMLLGYEIFLPIMGRSGSLITPELFIGLLTFVVTILSTNFFICLVYACKTLKYTRAFLLMLFLVSLAAVLGLVVFPYSGDPLKPAPKRILLEHISRTKHDQSGAAVRHESYVSVLPLDYLGISHMESYIPALKDAPKAVCEKDMPYCGHPYYLPLLHVFRDQWILPGGEPQIDVETTFKLDTRIKKDDRQNLTFTVSGPSHINLFVSFREGVDMISWSLSPEKPLKTLDGTGNWVYYICYGGGQPEDSWKFWMDMKVPTHFDEADPIVDVGVAGLHFTDFKTSRELEDFIQQQPDWVFTIPFLGVYDSWIF
ncbi:endoplasmic reticulum metallopeptidase 1-like [Asterias rubens]|uniref:endoplasmic reticulum metallopeptidase 1-like n=1 Tax=Asterias rubens TaxID=7604 RepID=UPI0014558397|nr:endoplasmic reticulum metallopeptidase 1-like [Asterias rubens]